MPYNHKVIQALDLPCLVLKPVEDDFIVIDANEAFQKVTRENVVELSGRPMKETFPRPSHPESIDHARFLRSLKKVVRTGKKKKIKCLRFDVPSRRGNGLKEKYWTVRNTPIFNEEGKLEFIVHSLIDITKKVKQKRKKEKEKRKDKTATAVRPRAQPAFYRRQLRGVVLHRPLWQLYQRQ